MSDRQAENDGTTWRYAMTRESAPTGDWFAIREVYTGPDGALSWSTEPVTVGGDTWMECADDLAIMGRAIGTPVLDLTLDPPAWMSVRDARRPSTTPAPLTSEEGS